jgi:hypothetical protein
VSPSGASGLKLDGVIDGWHQPLEFRRPALRLHARAMYETLGRDASHGMERCLIASQLQSLDKTQSGCCAEPDTTRLHNTKDERRLIQPVSPPSPAR